MPYRIKHNILHPKSNPDSLVDSRKTHTEGFPTANFLKNKIKKFFA
jgi:hypothetical protein